MIALWVVGYVLMLGVTLRIVWSILTERALTDDQFCVIDCLTVVALGCYVEGILFGLSGVGV